MFLVTTASWLIYSTTATFLMGDYQYIMELKSFYGKTKMKQLYITKRQSSTKFSLHATNILPQIFLIILNLVDEDSSNSIL